MSIVEQLVSLAETNPGDTVANLEYHDNDHIVIATNNLNITTTIDELEAAGKECYRKGLSRLSVYVDLIRYFLGQAHCVKLREWDADFGTWVMFPWPNLSFSDPAERAIIAMADRLVDLKQVRHCAKELEQQHLMASPESVLKRLTENGEDAAVSWNRHIDELKANGWSYGERFKLKAKQAPHIVPFAELPADEQDRIRQCANFIDQYPFVFHPEEEYTNTWTTQ